MNGTHDHLPIKIVVTSDADMHAPHAGGGRPKDFSDRYPTIRDSLLHDVGKIEQAFEATFTRSNLPAVARVRLCDDAIAKSHRPDALLQRTCPIIGGENFGELLTSVRHDGIRHLKQLLATTTDQKLQSDIGKITSIQPYLPEDALGHLSIHQFVGRLREHRISELKLRLFSHRNATIDAQLEQAMGELVATLHLPSLTKLDYGPGLRLFRVRLPSADAVGNLANFVGTQALSPFEHFVVSTQATPISNISPDDLPHQGIGGATQRLQTGPRCLALQVHREPQPRTKAGGAHQGTGGTTQAAPVNL